MRSLTITKIALLAGLSSPVWAAEADNELSLQRLDEANALLEQSMDRMNAAGTTPPEVATHLARANTLLEQAREEMRQATRRLEEKITVQ